MCFAPQQRALFQHLNLQKWREHVVILTFWLGNVLRATTACTFSTSQLPKMVRTPSVFNILTCFAPQRRALFRHRNFQKWSEPLVLLTFWLRNVLRATTACTFSTSQLPKMVRTPGVFNMLTSKCASRHNGVHFFDISTSKSGPKLVLCTFWRRNVLRATTACTFSTSQLPKVVRAGVLCTFWLRNVLRATTACNFSSLIWPAGSAPAALASLLFDPPGPQIIGKTQCFATFLPFRASASSFFWLFLFSDLLSSTLLFSLPLPISAFHLSILSEVWRLNFLRPKGKSATESPMRLAQRFTATASCRKSSKRPPSCRLRAQTSSAAARLTWRSAKGAKTWMS